MRIIKPSGGKTDKVENIRIVWPSGTSQVLRNVKADQVLRINELE